MAFVIGCSSAGVIGGLDTNVAGLSDVVPASDVIPNGGLACIHKAIMKFGAHPLLSEAVRCFL
jgi:hypothetical protein